MTKTQTSGRMRMSHSIDSEWSGTVQTAMAYRVLSLLCYILLAPRSEPGQPGQSRQIHSFRYICLQAPRLWLSRHLCLLMIPQQCILSPSKLLSVLLCVVRCSSCSTPPQAATNTYWLGMLQPPTLQCSLRSLLLRCSLRGGCLRSCCGGCCRAGGHPWEGASRAAGRQICPSPPRAGARRTAREAHRHFHPGGGPNPGPGP